MSDSDFLMVRPVTMQNALLTSSNVPETDYAAYNAGTTYALADAAILVSPAATVTISVGNPAIITWTAHNLPIGTPVVFTTTGALPTGILPNVVYYIVSTSTNTFKISQVESGDQVATSGTQSGVHTCTAQIHKVFESLQAGNIGHYPTAAASSTWWLEVSQTNRWKMFDEAYNSQTTNLDTIAVDITPGVVINTVALLNVAAASVRVQHSGSGYDRTIQLASHPVLNWYDWLFEDVIRQTDVVFSDVPPYAAGMLTITIDNTGATAGCGVCIVGKQRRLGSTLWDASRTINDYSATSEDAYGNVNLLKRSYSKRLNMDFYVDVGFESEVTRLLEEFRATPLVFIGSEIYSMTIIYGFLGAWQVPISISGSKPANIEIKGLI